MRSTVARGIVIAAGLAMSACATTKIVEYRNSAGEIRRCQPNVEAMIVHTLIAKSVVSDGPNDNEFARYRQCKADAEQAGFVRTPAGQETEETKQMIRDADAARAASIRKP